MSNKPKKLKRRATISGSIIGQSPTTLHPPIRIEDLVNLNNTENYYLNKDKSIGTSHLNVQDLSPVAVDIINDAGTINLYKSFNSLSTTDCILIDDLKPSLSKRTCSEDDSQFKKRTVSVCYNEVHGVNNEFFKQNYLQLPKQHSNDDKVKCEKFNQSDETSDANSINQDYCFRNKHNATVIKVNAISTKSLPLPSLNVNNSSSDFENFDQVNENYFNQNEGNRLSNTEVTNVNKNILHVLGSTNHENELINVDMNKLKDKKTTFELMELNSQNKCQSKHQNQHGVLTVQERTRTNQLDKNDLKIDKDTHCSTKYSSNEDAASVIQSNKEYFTEIKKEHLKPEVLKRKLNKQAKCE